MPKNHTPLEERLRIMRDRVAVEVYKAPYAELAPDVREATDGELCARQPDLYGQPSRDALFNRFTLAMPQECVVDCAHQGECDEDCELWAERLWFDDIDAEDIRAELKETGAWDSEELADDAQNRVRLVWIAAGQIKDEDAASDRRADEEEEDETPAPYVAPVPPKGPTTLEVAMKAANVAAWHAEPAQFDQGNSTVICQPMRGIVATIHGETDDNAGTCDFTREEDHQNATLLAAAPALRFALATLQASPNDPRAHRIALDALALITK